MDLTTAKLDTELVKYVLVSVSDTHITIPIGECPSYQTQLMEKLDEVYNKTLTDTPFHSSWSGIIGAEADTLTRNRHYLVTSRLKERFTSQIIPLVEKLENKSTEMSTEFEKTIKDLKERIRVLEQEKKDFMEMMEYNKCITEKQTYISMMQQIQIKRLEHIVASILMDKSVEGKMLEDK